MLRQSGRGFPTDFPVVGSMRRDVMPMRRGFPTDFPVVGCRDRHRQPSRTPWLPYRFPRGRLGGRQPRADSRRGFPTDFPVVGSQTALASHRAAVASLPISPW